MTTQEAPETPEVQPEPEAKGLRAQNDQLRKENRELKAGKRDDVITGLGLELDKGIGMVLVEQFEKGDLPLNGIAEAATKYGHVQPEVAPVNPTAQAIAESQQALDNLQGAAGSIAPPTHEQLVEKAESERDNNATIAYKGAKLEGMLRP